MKSGFRCPYEILGLKNKTILHVDWTNDRTQRLRDGKAALQNFYSNTNLVGIIINLPDDPCLQCCTTPEQLNAGVLKYCIEVMAIQTDVRFYPLLSYQQSTPVSSPAFKRSSYDQVVAYQINRAIHRDTARKPQNLEELADYYGGLVERLFPERYSYERGSIKLGNETKVSPLGIEVSNDIIRNLHDPHENKNLFLLVRGPLYPKSIGRYSKKFQITLTRHSDITKLDSNTARIIRSKNNAAIREAGFVIRDINEDQQNPGVWIPETA